MMAEYMSDKIGNEYEGIISSVTNFGMFVQLDNTIEGLIRMEDMKDDYYLYDSEHMRLVGERTKQEYKIGMQVKVKVTDVKINYREIDFVLVHDENN
jgi:ribonuclease R